MVSAPIIMGRLNLEVCQNFVAHNFSPHLWGDKPLCGGGVKIIWGSNIYYYTFHYFIFLETAKHPEN